MAAYVASPAVRAAAHVIEDQWLGTQLAENATLFGVCRPRLAGRELFTSPRCLSLSGDVQGVAQIVPRFGFAVARVRAYAVR